MCLEHLKTCIKLEEHHYTCLPDTNNGHSRTLPRDQNEASLHFTYQVPTMDTNGQHNKTPLHFFYQTQTTNQLPFSNLTSNSWGMRKKTRLTNTARAQSEEPQRHDTHTASDHKDSEDSDNALCMYII